MLCPHCHGNVLYRNYDGDPNCLCGCIIYSKTNQPKQPFRYPPHLKQYANTLKFGQYSVNAINKEVDTIIGRPVPERTIRRWVQTSQKI
jgi:hypothetical protein